MRRLLTFIILLAALIPAGATAQTHDRWGCDDLDAYQRDIVTILDAEDMQDLFDLMERLDTLRPSQLQTVSDLLDEWASGLEDMPSRDVPSAARPYHEALILNLGLLSAATSAMATGGIFGAIAYTEQLEEASLLMEEANDYGRAKCGHDWPFAGEEGTL